VSRDTRQWDILGKKVSLFFVWSVTSGLRAPISACFAPWATRLLSQWMLHWWHWQHRAWSFPLHPSTRFG